jgi:hypothetical protein
MVNSVLSTYDLAWPQDRLDLVLGKGFRFFHTNPGSKEPREAVSSVSMTAPLNKPSVRMSAHTYSSFRATDQAQANSGSCIADNSNKTGRLNQVEVPFPSLRSTAPRAFGNAGRLRRAGRHGSRALVGWRRGLVERVRAGLLTSGRRSLDDRVQSMVTLDEMEQRASRVP